MTRRQRQQRRAHDQLTEQPPPHQQERRACARDQFCKQATVTHDGDTRIVHPALTYRAFCEDDRAEIVSALVRFPAQYRQLLADLHDIRASGQVPGATFGSRMPIYADVDAAARRIRLVVTSWEKRIRDVPRIDTAAGDDPAPPDDETTDAAFFAHDDLPDGLSPSVPETIADFVEFRRSGRFVAK